MRTQFTRVLGGTQRPRLYPDHDNRSVKANAHVASAWQPTVPVQPLFARVRRISYQIDMHACLVLASAERHFSVEIGQCMPEVAKTSLTYLVEKY